MTVAVGHEEAEEQTVVERLLVFVTDVVYVGEPGVKVAVDHAEDEGDTVVVHVRVPGVRVPELNAELDGDTVTVYVGVPGVRVPV